MSAIARGSWISVLAIAAAWIAVQAQPKQPSVKRGKYIVEDVAHCERCHTPRDERGNADRARWLMGGPVQIRPTYPAPDWAAVAPPLAGQPPGTDAEVVKLLTTGIWKTGEPPKPPMLQFHMTEADARAVLAYLKSLGR